MIRLVLCLIAMVGLSIPASMVWALSTFDPPRQFVVTASCNATVSIRPGSASTAVRAGQTFKAFGTNKKKPDATHVQIDVQGKRRWIDITCGELRVAVAGKVKAPIATGRPSKKTPSAVTSTALSRDFSPFLTTGAIRRQSALVARQI